MDRWTDGWMDGRTDGKSPHSTGLLPYWGRCPAAALLQPKNCIKRGKGTADHMMPLDAWFIFSRELRLYKRVCPSVRQSINPFVYPLVGHTRVKIARKYFSSIKFITKDINVFVTSLLCTQQRGLDLADTKTRTITLKNARERICSPNSVRLVRDSVNCLTARKLRNVA